MWLEFRRVLFRSIMQVSLMFIFSLSIYLFSEKNSRKISTNHPLAFILLLLLCFSMYLSITTYYSMCLQSKIRSNTIKQSEVDAFPSIPNITEYVMPINGMQANFYYSKKNYKKAEYYLNKKINNNPYYFYNEYVRSRMYFSKHIYKKWKDELWLMWLFESRRNS